MQHGVRFLLKCSEAGALVRVNVLPLAGGAGEAGASLRWTRAGEIETPPF